MAGGILFSPLGPFGALTGRVVGGVLGGMIASAVSGKIAGALVEEDRVKILAMIQEQVTWLAGSFLLTGHEIENLNENLARVMIRMLWRSFSPPVYNNGPRPIC